MARITAEEAGGIAMVHFLDLIAFSEGTSSSAVTKNDGYDVIVTGVGGPEVFTDYSDHPFARGREPQIVRAKPPLRSTASGRYQLLLRFWRSYQAMLKLPDFSPLSQDKVAMRMIYERGVHPGSLDSDLAGAIAACSNLWASLPGNDYGQGGKTLDALLTHYDQLKDAVSA